MGPLFGNVRPLFGNVRPYFWTKILYLATKDLIFERKSFIRQRKSVFGNEKLDVWTQNVFCLTKRKKKEKKWFPRIFLYANSRYTALGGLYVINILSRAGNNFHTKQTNSQDARKHKLTRFCIFVCHVCIIWLQLLLYYCHFY